jgi:hypothetical protein
VEKRGGRLASRKEFWRIPGHRALKIHKIETDGFPKHDYSDLWEGKRRQIAAMSQPGRQLIWSLAVPATWNLPVSSSTLNLILHPVIWPVKAVSRSTFTEPKEENREMSRCGPSRNQSSSTSVASSYPKLQNSLSDLWWNHPRCVVQC